MKTIVMSLSAALLMMAAVTNANAVTCAEGVRRAGCVGPEGAVAVRKPEAVVVAPQKDVVVVPKKEVVVVPEKEVVGAPAGRPCRMVGGVRVCR